MAPPPELMDDILEDIFLRLPADDPARLVHAALVCRDWCRLIAGHEFRRRYRDLHGAAAPLLGLLSNTDNPNGVLAPKARFIPTSSFRPPGADGLLRDWDAIDARHGRDLLHRGEVMHHVFMVWDPATDERRELPGLSKCYCWNAAVLCATTTGACDHLDCCHGDFLVVFVASTTRFDQFFVHIYSSQDGSWSEPTYSARSLCDYNGTLRNVPGVLLGNTLHFEFSHNRCILKYSLGAQEFSVVQLPHFCYSISLMTREDGGLGLAIVEGSTLHLWSIEDGHDEDAVCVHSRAIDLKKLLPVSAFSIANIFQTFPHVAGAAGAMGVILLRTRDGLFTIDVKSGRAVNVCPGDCHSRIIPYMSFCTPVLSLTSKSEGPSLSSSRARKIKTPTWRLLGRCQAWWLAMESCKW